MRGAWRPFVVYGSIPVALVGFYAAAGGPLAWGAYVGMAVAVVPFVAFVAALGILRGGAFLRGLAEAGEVVEVERDVVSWGGDRSLVVRGVHGTWRVEASSGKVARVDVLGPRDDAPWRATGRIAKAARAAAARVAEGGASAPPPRVVTTARLVLYVAVFFGTFVFIALAVGGPRAALWTAAALAPVFAWLAWKVVKRGRPVLQDSSGRVLDP